MDILKKYNQMRAIMPIWAMNKLKIYFVTPIKSIQLRVLDSLF